MSGRRDSAVAHPAAGERPGCLLLLLRHGAAEGSGEGRLVGRTDAALLPPGEAQMREAAAGVRDLLRGAGAAMAFASPRRRARRSAEVLMEALDPPSPASALRVVEGLAEVDLGEWEGETYASLMAKDPGRMRAHYADIVRSRPPGGESLEDLRARVLPAWGEIRAQAAGGCAVVVAHAAVNRVILCDALGIPLENFFRLEQDFAALNAIEYHGGAPFVRLING